MKGRLKNGGGKCFIYRWVFFNEIDSKATITEEISHSIALTLVVHARVGDVNVLCEPFLEFSHNCIQRLGYGPMLEPFRAPRGVIVDWVVYDGVAQVLEVGPDLVRSACDKEPIRRSQCASDMRR